MSDAKLHSELFTTVRSALLNAHWEEELRGDPFAALEQLEEQFEALERERAHLSFHGPMHLVRHRDYWRERALKAEADK